MIYTVTFNPSLDYVVSVPDFQPGKTNRTVSEQLYPGGKGINVSIVLNNLGIESTALGFTAGFTGREIRRRLLEMGICTDFIPLSQGTSRINVKLKDIEGTEINGMGPVISQLEKQILMEKLRDLQASDVLVLAGSIPASLGSETYREILEPLEDKGILTVVDAAGELLRNVLPYHPFLIKPNNQELGQLFGVELPDRESVIPYAIHLRQQGARNVLVSLAGQGAVLAAEDGRVYMAEAPDGTLVNGVGAGDSMVAGFLAGWLNSGSYEKAFSLAVASGSASAFCEHLAKKEQIMNLYHRVFLK